MASKMLLDMFFFRSVEVEVDAEDLSESDELVNEVQEEEEEKDEADLGPKDAAGDDNASTEDESDIVGLLESEDSDEPSDDIKVKNEKEKRKRKFEKSAKGSDIDSPSPSCSYVWQAQSVSPAVSLFSDCGVSSNADEDNISFPDPKKAVVAVRNQPLLLTDLPPEIMEHIFRFLPFQTVAKQVRLVCRDFNAIASSLLNSEFQRLRTAMQQRFLSLKSQMPRRESARRKHPLNKESEIIETIHLRLTLLHMTFNKSIAKKDRCFFAGEILDEVYRILRYVKTTPTLGKSYKVMDELFDLSTMAMEYFKEHVKHSVPEGPMFSPELHEYECSLISSPNFQLPILDESSSSSCTNKPPAVVKNLPPGPELSPAIKKQFRKLRDNVKRNNDQVNALKEELRVTKRKVSTQQKYIHELKARFEDYDKEIQSVSRKLNSVLQELSHCKTELQYWRSKSPGNQGSCGKVTPSLEIKECDHVSSQDPINDIALQCSGGGDDSTEEFKPILEADLTATDNNYFVVIPDCRRTQTHKCAPILSETSLKTEHDDRNVKPVAIISKGCKRKLALGHDDDDDQQFVKVPKYK